MYSSCGRFARLAVFGRVMVSILSSDDVMHNLTKECDAVQLFIDLLKKEEDALIHGRMEEVDLLASEKNRIIVEITDYSSMRCQQLSYQGFSSDSSGMNDWLAEQSESVALGSATPHRGRTPFRCGHSI